MIEGTETTVTSNEGNVSEPIVTPATETVAVEPVVSNEPVIASNEPVAVEPVVVQPVEQPAKPKRNRKAKSKAKPAKVSVKRGRGRPAVFTGNTKRHIVSVIRKHGLTGGRVVLAEEGTSISLPTLGKFAAEAGIELHRGRPKAA
jgi:hypothetical protein